MNDKTIDTKPLAQDKKPASKTITCNLHNPTRARRIIYDGITDEFGRQKSITVEVGETKKNVTISREIAEELRDRNRAKKDSDLRIMPLTVDAVAEEPAAAE